MERSQSWPNFTQEEADAVSRVLLSNKVNYWTGDEGRRFENEFAAFAEVEHAIAVANGTVALDLALHGLRIGAHNGGSHRDEVIVTPRSFIASVSCVVNAGAVPVFADVDRETANISPLSVAPIMTERTRGIICVHLAGWPCDMDGFRELVDGQNIALIEDCAQAHGARYKGRSVGSLGDVAAWSFCQDKIMTTGGEGGMVTCNNKELSQRMWSYKDHGKSWTAVYERNHQPGFRWLHNTFGTNWRMTEMQAAIGRIQLRRMSKWAWERQENAIRLAEFLEPLTINSSGFLRIPNYRCGGCEGGQCASLNCQHAWYKYYAFIDRERLPSGLTRDDLVLIFQNIGLRCFHGGCSEIYLERAFDAHPSRPKERLPAARELGETSLMFEVHPGALPPNLSDRSISELALR